jgi:demethylmenaquinone methyltransferase/2-methoxy-6-polyprenyl-1,4-benzoquinol methylase
VRRAEVPTFLDAADRRLGAGGRVVLFDNRFVAGSSTDLSRRDPAGDTYQMRRLQDGRSFEVLKNFFGGDELRVFLRGRTDDAELVELRYYWAVSYHVRGEGART